MKSIGDSIYYFKSSTPPVSTSTQSSILSSKVLLTEGRGVQENLAVVAEPFAEMLQSGNVLWNRCEGQWMSDVSEFGARENQSNFEDFNKAMEWD